MTSLVTIVIRGCLSLIALLLGITSQEVSLGVVGALLSFFIEVTNPLALKNLFLAYVFLLFGVSGRHVYPDDNGLIFDLLLFASVFLMSYHLECRIGIRGSVEGPARKQLHLALITRLLIVLLVVRGAYTAWRVVSVYGIAEYLNGAALVEQISVYGRSDVSAGLDVVITYALAILSLALVALYCAACYAQERQPRFSLLVAMLIGLPLLRLQRGEVVLGTLTFLVIYLFRWTRRDATRFRGVAVGLGLALAIGTAVSFGILRDNVLRPAAASAGLDEQVSALAYSELSPVIVYHTIKTDAGGLLQYQGGQTLVLPFIFKVVPRNFLPDKPINSGAYYAELYSPLAFSAGFAIAPTLFGALFLNFGYAGCLIGVFLLGLLAARLDLIVVESRGFEMGWYVILYYEFYPLLRNDPSDTLAVLALVGGAYLALSWGLKAGQGRIGWRSRAADRPQQLSKLR